MLGLYGGWWTAQTGEADPSIALKMAGVMQGSHSEQARLPGGVLLGRRHHGVLDQRSSVATSADGRWSVVVDGELLERGRLLRQHLGNCDALAAQDSGATAAALLGAAGFAWLADAHGLFTLAGFDHRTETLFLVTDRFGLRPLYVHAAGGAVQFSSDMVAVALAATGDVALSPTALAEWITFGMFLDDATWFAGIRQLPGATIAQWSRTSSSERRYWDWSAIERQHVPRRETHALDEVCERWLHVAHRQAPQDLRAVVPLSGGLDSRLLFASLPPGADVHALTFGVPSSPDVRIAQAVAAVRGCPHHLLPIDSGNWLQGRLAASNQTGCLVNAIHAHNVIGLPLLRELGGICYDGYGGDGTIGGQYLAPPGTSAADYLVQRLSSGGPLAMDPGAARARILESWRRSGLPPDLFQVEARGRRFINAGTLRMRLGTEVRLPFLDADFMPFVMALPENWRAKSRLYRRMVTRLHPRYFEKIAWEKTGVPVGAPVWQERIVNIGRRIDARVRTIASYRLGLDVAASYVNYEAWSRTPDTRQAFEGLLLAGDARWPQWIDADRGRQIVRDHLDGRRCRTDAVMGLASLESWLRHLDQAGVRLG